MISIETLRQQLETSKLDVEQSKAVMHRAEGMVMLIQHLITEAALAGTDHVLDAVSDKVGN